MCIQVAKRTYLLNLRISKGIKLKVSTVVEGDVELIQKTLSASRLSRKCICSISGTAKSIKLNLSGNSSILSKVRVRNISEMAMGINSKLSGHVELDKTTTVDHVCHKSLCLIVSFDNVKLRLSS